MHGKTPQYAGDLYISPQGNDHNTGVTAGDPLKTILYAFSKILADSLHPCSIRLAPGTYSPSATGEPFPIKMESYITLQGTSSDSVILDGEGKYQVAEAKNIMGSGLENLSVIHGLKKGNGGGVVCINSGMKMDYVSLTCNSAPGYWTGRPRPVFVPGRGGGLYCDSSEVFLKNITFTDDTACYGGGLYVSDSRLGLQAVTLTNNTARIGGGGVYVSGSSFSFDTLHRPNIYGNFAHDGNDLYSDTLLHFVADTFSVKHPTDFYATPITHFTFDIRHGLQEQADADLYVSPTGNDGNTGLTQVASLKTLNAAFRRIRADNLSQHTLHLMNGTYSPSGTGELFPVNIPDFLKVEGAGDSAVILDAEGQTGVVEIMENTVTCLSGLTVKGGSAETGAGIGCLNSNAVIQMVSVTDNKGIDGGGIGCVNSNLQLTGSRIAGNLAAGWVTAGGPGSRSARGGGFYCGSSLVRVCNTLFCGNSVSYGDGGGVYLESQATLDNVTIEGNSLTTTGSEGAGLYCGGGSATVRNSIIWNNQPQGIYGNPAVTYSNIQEGWPGEGNISTNPQFAGHGLHPYMITAASACRNAGTPDTTGMFLPATDLAGGPRIWDGRIDMGAYEWSNVGEEDMEVGSLQFAVRSFPEPFTKSTTFSYKLPEPSQVTVRIFNSFGQPVAMPVKQAQSAGEHKVTWDSGDLPAGMYYYRVQAGKQVGSGKMIKM